MRSVQCFYCGRPGDWRMFDTDVNYKNGGGPIVKKVETVAICDEDLERNGPPPLPKRNR